MRFPVALMRDLALCCLRQAVGDISVQTDEQKQLSYSIMRTAQVLSISERSVYKLMDAGTLRRVKLGRRTLIPAAQVHALIGNEA